MTSEASAEQPSVTILFPFDIGFSLNLPSGNVLGGRTERNWRAENRFPSHIGAPFGEPVTYVIPPEDANLARALSTTKCCDLTRPAEIVFFPVGIAILVVSGTLCGPPEERWQRYEMDWEPSSYEQFRSVATSAANEYKKLLSHSGGPKIDELDRSRDSRYDFEWVYPLFFGVKGAIAGAEGAFCGRVIDIRWRGADVYAPAGQIAEQLTDQRNEIEALFLIAAAAWQMMYVVDGFLSASIMNWQQSRNPTRQKAIGLRSVRVMRAFVSYIVDGSRPLRWSIVRQTYRLLEKIHDAWDTPSLWKAVEQKMELLALLYEQNESEMQEGAASRLNVAAFSIAIFSSLSAGVDLLSVWDPDATTIPNGWRRLLAVLAAVVMVLAFAALVVRRGLTNRKSSG